MSVELPQANDTHKLIEIPHLISLGKDTARALASHFSFSERQAQYYLHASELLGLIARGSKKGSFVLTVRGDELSRTSAAMRPKLFADAMVATPAITVLLDKLSENPEKTLSRGDIEQLFTVGDEHSTTLPRRVDCLLNWLWWLAYNTGRLKVDDNGVSLS